MASPTQINIQQDDSRLRDVELSAALNKVQLEDHERVIGAIENHLGALTTAFQEYRVTAAAEFSKFQIRALGVAVLVFASSSNAERALRLIGVM